MRRIIPKTVVCHNNIPSTRINIHFHTPTTTENASSPRLVSDVSGNLTESGDVDVHADPETGGWQDAKHHAAPLTGWGITTFILLADMLGLGSLTLPGDLARLGWITGIGSILLAGLGMMYTGTSGAGLPMSMMCRRRCR